MSPLNLQTHHALTMFYAGICAGIVYDIFGLLRALCGGKFIPLIFTDILFCLSAGVLFAGAVLVSTLGELHLYSFICFFAGIVLHFLTIKPIIRAIRCRSIRFFTKRRERKRQLGGQKQDG